MAMASAARRSARLFTVADRAASDRAWWKKAVFYQIYPRSFADGNGDGIGDLIGIIDRIDYLAELGIDAIWLSPHYPSPLADLGYDVSDYEDVHPDYGTLADFRGLLVAARARAIRVVIDLVLNHTSDQHPWFVESRSDRDNPRRDWYVWADSRDGGPPNNWMSQFGGSAWELDPATNQYYYHCFLREQPDLNFRNPDVRAAIADVMRFWLDLGVDGFRLDAPDAVFEDATLADHAEPRSLSELRRAWIAAGSDAERAGIEAGLATMFARQLDQPEVHGLMRELRAVVDAYPDRVLIGETDQVAYCGSNNDELHLVFDFPLMRSSWLTADIVRRHLIERWAAIPEGGWDAITLGNHDEPRVRGRHGTGTDDLATARLSAALALTLPGTPFLYYGEEIGMTDLLLHDAALFRDNWGLWLHRAAADELGLSASEALEVAARHGRDKARTPMHWSSSPNAGFSPPGIPTWLPVHANHAAGINVAEQREDPGSLLRFYRRLLEARRRHDALVRGDCILLDTDASDSLAFLRSVDGRSCLVVLNMSPRDQAVELDLPDGELHLLVSSRERPPVQDARAALRLEPYEAYVAELVPTMSVMAMPSSRHSDLNRGPGSVPVRPRSPRGPT
jgi:alpha-glucosidase